MIGGDGGENFNAWNRSKKYHAYTSNIPTELLGKIKSIDSHHWVNGISLFS